RSKFGPFSNQHRDGRSFYQRPQSCYSCQTVHDGTDISITYQIDFPSSYSHSIMSLDVDVIRKKLYVFDRYTAAIYMISNFTVDHAIGRFSWNQLHAGVSRGSVKLAVDWISNNLYWTDPMYRWIAVQSLDNYGMFKILFHSDLEYHLGIAVDPIHNYLFWSDAGSTPKIERSTLTGTDRKVIVSTGILYLTAIDVDIANSKLYWTDASRDTVEMTSFTGSGKKKHQKIFSFRFLRYCTLSGNK
ncbi:LRP6-like protein, partial [Mya arenaria]